MRAKAAGQRVPTETPRDEGRDRPWARRIILCAVLLLAASLAWRTEASRDFGFHVATGRWILEHHAWPQVDSFTYPLAGRPYVDMHGLFQVALALAYRWGMAGIGLLRLGLVLTTLGMLWIHARRRDVRSPELLGLGLGLALCAWEVRIMTRPELMSDVCLAIQLLLLRRHAEGGGARWLYATIPLQLVWVYSHALSCFGIAVLALYAVTSLAGGRRRRAVDPTPWLVLAGAVAVMFLNPYGARGVAFLWSLRTRIESGNAFGDSIGELMSPFSGRAAAVPALRAFKALFLATALVVLVRARRMSLFDLAVVALFGTLAATRMRMIGLFAIAVLPIALEAASESGRSLFKGLRTHGSRAGAWTTSLVTVALLLLCEQVVAGGYYAMNHYPFRFGYRESPAVFPLETAEYLDRHALSGRIFNSLDLGGYLIMHRDPRDKVFIDGRLEVVGEEFYREYSEAVAGDGWDRLVTHYQPSVALVANTAHELVQRLAADSTWSAIDVDGAAVLFVRDTPNHRETIAESSRRLSQLNAPAGVHDEAIVPPPRISWPAALFGSRRPAFDSQGRGNAFVQLGMIEAARREYRRALLAPNVLEPGLVKAYVLVTEALGRTDEARAWCHKLIEIAPRDPQARELMARLGPS